MDKEDFSLLRKVLRREEEEKKSFPNQGDEEEGHRGKYWWQSPRRAWDLALSPDTGSKWEEGRRTRTSLITLVRQDQRDLCHSLPIWRWTGSCRSPGHLSRSWGSLHHWKGTLPRCPLRRKLGQPESWIPALRPEGNPATTQNFENKDGCCCKRLSNLLGRMAPGHADRRCFTKWNSSSCSSDYWCAEKSVSTVDASASYII